MQTYNADGEAESGWVRFQLKATDSLRSSADGSILFLRLEWRDLLYWLNEQQPVLLVLYDAQDDRAYWLYVQDYFRRIQWKTRAAAAKTATVRIPVENVLDEAAIRLFARFRDAFHAAGEEKFP